MREVFPFVPEHLERAKGLALFVRELVIASFVIKDSRLLGAAGSDNHHTVSE
jgi:hypothetical protein